jgi:ABC-type multidrug transport system permease subunit
MGISARRAWSQAYRSLILIRANSFRLLDVTIWPFVLLMSTLLFAGFVTAQPQIIGMIVLGALGWRTLYHFQIEPVQGVMDEYWDRSLEHLMVSPVRVSEILLGGLVVSLLKTMFVATMFLTIGYLLFGFVVASWTQLRLAALAVMACGATLAIFSLGVAFLQGNESYGFIFAFTDVIAVLSGVLYPTTVFPAWLESAVQVFPTTHAFNMLKGIVGIAQPNVMLFFLTLALWLCVAVAFCAWAFRKAKREGRLVRMK